MKKKAFVLRVSPAMMEKLEKWAADDFRSVNGQIEWILDQALRKAGRNRTPEPDAGTEQKKGKGHEKPITEDEQYIDKGSYNTSVC